MASDFSRISLLYVEDDEATRRLVSQILSHTFPGLQIHTAQCGEEGVNLFKEFGHNIVVSDIIMTGIDGIQMAKEIQAHNPETLCIFTTAITGDPECLSQAQQISRRRIFFKPTDCIELIRGIGECITAITQKGTSRLSNQKNSTEPDYTLRPQQILSS